MLDTLSVVSGEEERAADEVEKCLMKEDRLVQTDLTWTRASGTLSERLLPCVLLFLKNIPIQVIQYYKPAEENAITRCMGVAYALVCIDHATADVMLMSAC